MRPRVDDFVVALTVRDVSSLIRALETLDALGCILKQSFLLFRNMKVFDTNRNSTARCVAESEFLQAIEERHGAGESSLAIRLEDKLTKRLLLHVMVLVAELL